MSSVPVNPFFPAPYAGGMKPKPAPAQPDGFPRRLAALRKERGLTQLALAELASCGITQLKRYESGASQPTLDVIRRLARALRASSDELLFGEGERGPDAELRLQLEAVSRFGRDEKKALRALLEGLILKHEARRWSSRP
jgi:transcriptional regulator with XRE-family HTH domain